MIDIHGNFADVSEEARWFDTEYHYIGRDSLTPEGYQEVEKEIRNLRAGRTKFRRFPSELESLGESILAKLEDWELDLQILPDGSQSLQGIKSKIDGRKITLCYEEVTHYVIVYRLGYRGKKEDFSWKDEGEYKHKIRCNQLYWRESERRIKRLEKIYQKQSTQNQNNSIPNDSPLPSDSPTNSQNINADNPNVSNNDNKNQPNNFNTQQNNDKDKINRNEDLAEARKNAQQIILAIFKNSNVKPDELNKNLWPNKSSWDEHLQSLTDKQQIINFVQRIRRQVEAKSNKKSSPQTVVTDGSNKTLIVFLIGGFIFGAVTIFINSKKRRSIRKSIKN